MEAADAPALTTDDPATPEASSTGPVTISTAPSALSSSETGVEIARPVKAPRRPVRSGFKLLLFAVIIYVFVLPLIPGFGKAAHKLRDVNPIMLVVGLGLELTALYCYSLLTRAAL